MAWNDRPVFRGGGAVVALEGGNEGEGIAVEEDDEGGDDLALWGACA